MLGHLKPGDPSLAAELVSPQYADDFFSGFKTFTNHEFAADLDPTYLDQIDEADEYMVFKGMLDLEEGIKPGYVTFLSTSQQVFLIVGYQHDAQDLFLLASQVIREGNAPLTYSTYTRVDLGAEGTIDPTLAPSNGGTTARRPAPTQVPASRSPRSQDQSAAVFSNPTSYIGETVVVSGDVLVSYLDNDGNTVIVLANQSSGYVMGFLIGYPGAAPGVTEGDHLTVTGIVLGVEETDTAVLPVILATNIN